MAATIQKINFEPVSNILATQKKDFVLADRTLADPNNSLVLIDGEWVTLDANRKLVRASQVGTVGNLAAVLSCPLFVEKGRSDVLSRAERGMTIIWLGAFEADTRVYDASAVVGSGLAITSMLQGVKVATVAIGGRNYSGLVGHGGSGDPSTVVGFVTALPTNNGGKLRIRGGTQG